MSHGHGGWGGHHSAPPPSEQHDGHGSQQLYEKVQAPQIQGDIVRVFSEADEEYSLGVRRDEVVMLAVDNNDEYQQWVRDESWSNKAKDSSGQPAFALINKGSGKALKRGAKMEDRVLLENYNKDLLNETVLWTISTDHGKEWHALRPVNDIDLNLDILNGTKDGGGVHDGQAVLVFKWKNKDNQKWKVEVHTDDTGATKKHFWK